MKKIALCLTTGTAHYYNCPVLKKKNIKYLSFDNMDELLKYVKDNNIKLKEGSVLKCKRCS